MVTYGRWKTKENFKLLALKVDCEQSLSFPSVFRAIEPWSNERRAVSGEPRTARSAGADKRKKKETAVVFLIFSICRLWHLFDWWFRPVCKTDTISRQSQYCGQLEFSRHVHQFLRGCEATALEIRTSSRLLHEIHKPSTYREMWANFLGSTSV